MGSVAQNEVVSAANPLVFFCFQIDGRLLDVVSLKRSIWKLAITVSPTQKLAESALDLTDAPTGTRLSQGVYHADFAATGYDVGTHEIRWKYIQTLGGPEIEVRQRFEVLDPNEFWSGRAYVGYASTLDLLKETALAAQTPSELQVLINEQSMQIEQWTGRFFEPRYQTMKIAGRSSEGLMLGPPIIGINRLQLESGVNGVSATLGDVDINALRIYARHLAGLLDPDDRDDPRIEVERFEGLLFQSFQFFPSSPQGVWVTGVFGYTDPNGTPWGATPKNLMRVIGHLMIPRLTDVFGQILTNVNPSIAQSARTRDQALSTSSGGGSSTSKGGGMTGRGAFGGLTGDDFVDKILIPYIRPPHMGAT